MSVNSNVNKHYKKIKLSLKEDIPTSHATIHPNQLRFLRGIAAGETRFSSREATKDRYNQAANNANVRKYGDAGKDYGYYQNNQNDVKDAVRRGVDPKLASALNGGGKTNNADLDTQTRAMHDYISKNPRFAKAYNTLSTEQPDFEAARKAMQNKWFALKNNAPQVQAAFKSKEQYGPVRDSSEQKALDAHGAYPELTHKAKVSNPTREEPTVQSRDRTDTDKTFGSAIPDVEFRQNKAPKEKEEPQIVYEGRVKDIVKAWRIHTRDERRRGNRWMHPGYQTALAATAIGHLASGASHIVSGDYSSGLASASLAIPPIALYGDHYSEIKRVYKKLREQPKNQQKWNEFEQRQAKQKEIDTQNLAKRALRDKINARRRDAYAKKKKGNTTS